MAQTRTLESTIAVNNTIFDAISKGYTISIN
jgi:hypothetical protein